MRPPTNVALLLQLFVAGLSAHVASSISLAAVYFARLEVDFKEIVAVATFFVAAGLVVAFVSLVSILVIGAKRLCSAFVKWTRSA